LTGSTQPGGRAPAPGQLAVVQAFINTHFDLDQNWGADVLSSPGALADWLQRHELANGAADHEDLRRAISVREHLRELAAHNGNGSRPAERLDALNDVASGAPSEVRFTARGPRFLPGRDGGIPAALGALLAMTAASMIDGSWWRLKICPGDHCGWAFYDHSRNQTGRWCSMSVCGGRAKARAHYRRNRDAGG
jgi:predicted RNA-binding Zn ribbon-like protein